jgi:hypothetical protein
MLDNFTGNDWLKNQQHKQMSLECFCRPSFIIPNAPKRKKKEKKNYGNAFMHVVLPHH